MSRPLNLPSGRYGIRRVGLVYSPIASGIPLLSTMEKAQQRPGLGLRYLKAVLESEGVEADIFDNLYDPEASARVHEVLNDRRYDLVGFHTTSASRGRALDTISKLDRDWYAGRVVAGGPGTLHEGELLKSGVDIVARGEGEATILEILAAYLGRKSFDKVPGISFLDRKGRTVSNPDAEPVDLASLPLPSWDADTVSSRQGDLLNITIRRPFFVVMGSRGCPYRCGFCATHQHWRRRYRPRPVDKVLEEVEWLVGTHGARYIHFLDDIFGFAPGWAEAFCDGMAKKDMDVHFSVVLHPTSFKKDRRGMLKRLRDVGCRLVSIGAQSADPQVLKQVRRSPGEPDALREIVAICNELGLVSVLTYIFGLPGDTNDSIRRTLDFVNEVKPTVVDFHPLLYLPGSEIADTMEQDRYSRLGNGEINQWCLRAYFEYYVKHGGGMRVLSYLLRHNPGWFTNMLPMGRHAMEYFGLFLFDRKGTKRFL